MIRAPRDDRFVMKPGDVEWEEPDQNQSGAATSRRDNVMNYIRKNLAKVARSGNESDNAT